MLQLDDVGYENLLIAVFSEPYITYAEYKITLEQEKRIKDEESRKGMGIFFKFIVCPIIYFKLFSLSATSILALSVIVGCYLIYKGIKKRKSIKTDEIQ